MLLLFLPPSLPSCTINQFNILLIIPDIRHQISKYLIPNPHQMYSGSGFGLGISSGPTGT